MSIFARRALLGLLSLCVLAACFAASGPKSSNERSGCPSMYGITRTMRWVQNREGCKNVIYGKHRWILDEPGLCHGKSHPVFKVADGIPMPEVTAK